MNIMLACPGCTLNAMFGLRYLSPVYEQLRWVILLGALFAFLLPWLCGYRLGEKVPYSKKRHAILSLVLFILPFFAVLAVQLYSDRHISGTFATELTGWLYLPFWILFVILRDITPLFYPAYIVGAAYLLLKFDRKFVPRNRETMEPEERQDK